MTCLHERIQSVNCVKSCLICGAKLPADFEPGKITTKPVEAAEKPAEALETAPRKRATKKGGK